MGIEVTGLSERVAALDQAAKSMFADVQQELNTTGVLMSVDAKRDHRFTSRSGRLEDSIKSDVPKDEMKLLLGFASDATQSNWKKAPHVVYGTFQHEGTYAGYLRSGAANAYEPTPGPPGSGIKADHFLVRAWEKHIGGLKERVKGIIYKRLKEAAERGVF